jgi:hypothetical protein
MLGGWQELIADRPGIPDPAVFIARTISAVKSSDDTGLEPAAEVIDETMSLGHCPPIDSQAQLSCAENAQSELLIDLIVGNISIGFKFLACFHEGGIGIDDA